MRETLYVNSDRYCWVYRTRGEYFLDAVCGTTGMYGVCIRLLPDEIDRFNDDPASVLEIAQDLCRHEDRYLDRTLDEPAALRLRTDTE